MSDAPTQFEIPIAIIGMACRLPGASNLDEYWTMLETGASPIAEMPPERFNEKLYFDPRKGVRGKSYSKLAGLLADRQFRRDQCPLPPSLQASADNAHLLMCEVAAAACRHAGLDPFALPLRNTGVYIGHAQGSDLAGELTLNTCIEEAAEFLGQTRGLADLPAGDREALINELVQTIRDRVPRREADSPDPSIRMVAGLISQAFGLTGPYLAINSACASSLQAIQLAARALQSGRIDMAIAGGASDCKEGSVVLFSHAQSMSATGSRPFDEQADGLVIAEGYVAVVLKTLPRALTDGDPIQALVTGIGCSSDGKGKSLWAPRKEGQVKAMERAYRGGLDVGTLQYVEAHATSTSLGDATELATLAEALGGKLPPGTKIPVTSVKANIGHALEAAGLAGLIKTVLCMQRRMTVAAINIESLNAKIDWATAPICIPRENRPWPEPPAGQPRRAAVNAFGIGGLNMHVVVEELTDGLRRRWTTEPHSLAVHGGQGTAVGDASPPGEARAIAIIGRGCILPGAGSVDAFWDLIRSNRDPKGPTPEGRWRSELALAPRRASTRRLPTSRGGYITDFAYDWQRHKVPPKQVQQADPLQFMLLEGAEQALRDAGYDQRPFDRQRVAVFVGTESGGDFGTQLCVSLRLPEIEAILIERLVARGLSSERATEIAAEYSEVLLAKWPALVDESGSFSTSTLASRITKTMNLMGGAAAIDAGDASAAAALASSVDLLLAGDCDLVICAGGQRCMNLPKFESLHLAGALADDAHAGSPFAATTRGILPGEGVGVLLLKRLADARRDGDPIHGIIRGIGAAHDARGGMALAQAVERAVQDAGVDPADVAVVEAAGTGLAELDAEHIQALVASYGRSPRREPLLLGTATGQLGHTIGASAMVSLLKASLEIEHGEMPANWEMREPLPDLADPSSAVRPALTAQPLRLVSADGRRFAAVDSIGNGLAYHILLERGQRVVTSAPRPLATPTAAPAAARTSSSSAPQPSIATAVDSLADTAAPERPSAQPRVDALADRAALSIYRYAAASPHELRALVERTMRQPGTATAGRFQPGDAVRLAVVAASTDSLVEKLATFLAQQNNSASRTLLERQGCYYRAVPQRPPRVAFLFPGQGSQYAGMLRELTSAVPAADAMRKTLDGLMAELGHRSFTQMAWEQPELLGADIWVTQSSVLLADLILHAALEAHGIRPQVVAGHSQGEYAALAASGALDLNAVLQAARARYEAIDVTPSARGALMATTAPPGAIEELAALLADRAYLANFNAPDQTVVGGKPATLEVLATLLKSRGHQAQMLSVPCPYHTPLMEGVGAKLRPVLDAIAVRPPQVPVISTVTNRYVAEPDDIRANLVAQLITPVRYVDLVRRLARDEPTVFVEVGPSRALTNLNQRILAECGDADVIASDNPKRPGAEPLLQVQALLECLGAGAQRDFGPIALGSGVATAAARGSIVHIDATESRRERKRRQAESNPVQHASGLAATRTSIPAEAPEVEGEILAAAVPGPAPSAAQRPLEGASPRAAPAPPDAPMPIAANSAQAPAGQSANGRGTAAPHGQGPDTADLEKFLINFVVEQTGYPPEVVDLDADLEADLGIDSIKKAQLFGELAEYFDARPAEGMTLDDFPTLRHALVFLSGQSAPTGAVESPPPAANGAAPPPPSASAPAEVFVATATRAVASPPDRVDEPRLAHDSSSNGASTSPTDTSALELEKFLINFVVEQTGYPPEVVDLDADLEADLGIDSIKKAQLFGELAEYFDARPAEGMTLDDFPTLRHALNFLVGAADSKKKVPASPADPQPALVQPSFAQRPAAEPSQAIGAADDSWPVAHWQGTPYHIGFAHGTEYRAAIVHLLRRFADLADGNLDETGLVPADRLSELFEFDELEELRGMADALQVPLANLLAVNVAIDMARGDGTEQCAQTLGRSATLVHLVRCSAPLPAALAECLELVVSLRSGGLGHPTILVHYAGLVGAMAGINRAGLAASAAPRTVAAAGGGRPYGRSYARVVRHILTQAANIDEAEQILSGFESDDGYEICLSHAPTSRAELICHPEAPREGRLAPGQAAMAAALRGADDLQQALERFAVDESWLVGFETRVPAIYLRTPELPTVVSRVDLARQWSCAAEPPASWSPGLAPSAPEAPPALASAATARFVMTLKPAPLPAETPRPMLRGAALVVGQSPAAELLCQRLQALGGTVFHLRHVDNLAEGLAQLETWWQSAPITHWFWMNGRDGRAQHLDDVAAWSHNRFELLELPFMLTQRWVQLAGQAGRLSDCTLVSATSLGGDFGFANRLHSPWSVTFACLAKALYIELAYMRQFRGFRGKALDFGDDEPPERLVESLVREWAAGSPDYEVAFSAGQRLLPYAAPQAAAGSQSPRAGGVWVVTGGARGITAECALALGRRFGLRLHLIGSSPPPALDPTWQTINDDELKRLKTQVMREARAAGGNMDDAWAKVAKAIEIDRRLHEFEQAGVRATYHACDVADSAALADVLETIRRSSGPIEGIIHGAGVERSAKFERKSAEHLQSTVGSKVDGAWNLMRLTWRDPIRHFLGFGSISGRMGSNGQVDYCIASDLLCKLIAWYRWQRPGVHATGFHWHSWAEIGMAAKAETAKVLERSQGPSAMPKQEGVDHFLREVLAPRSPAEVLVTTWEYHGRYYGTSDHPVSVPLPSESAESTARRESGGAAAAAHAPPAPEPEPGWEPAAAGIASRHRLTMAPAPLPKEAPHAWRPAGPVWIVGDQAWAASLEQEMVSRGATVQRLTIGDVLEELTARVEPLYQAGRPSAVFLTMGRDTDAPDLLSASGWRQRRMRGVVGPLAALQQLFRLRRAADDHSRLTILAHTALGGNFGFSHEVDVPEGGALCGLLKALFIEDSRLARSELRVKVIDAPRDEPPAELLAATLRELAADEPTIEVAWSRGCRSVVKAVVEPVETRPRRRVPRGGHWVVTGGARGITAAAAFELARRYGARLHLIGRSPAPDPRAPWRNATPERLAEIKAQVVREAIRAGQPVEQRWEPIRADLEIVATLERYQALGIDARYYSCDLADWERLAAVLNEIRQQGPIEGVVHGAGYGKSGRFDTRPWDNIERVLAGKLDGTVGLMALTLHDPIRYWIGFGSISGRFGGNGLADYAAANDMLAKLVDWYAGQRPDCAACCFHWQSWDEIGMAMLGDSSAGTKQTLKMEFLSPREGVEHFCREIEAGLPLRETLITDGFFERTFYAAAAAPTAPSDQTTGLRAATRGERRGPAGTMPLMGSVDPVAPGAGGVPGEKRAWMGTILLDPSRDPFLFDHRLRDKPLLPAVIGMELLAEAAALATGQQVCALRNVRFMRGVRFTKAEALELRVRVAESGAQQFHCELVSDFRSRSGKVLDRDRIHFAAEAQTCVAPATAAAASRDSMSSPPDAQARWYPFQYPDRGPMYHGPTLRGLEALCFAGSEGWGRLTALPQSALAGPQRPGDWLTPAVLIDAAFYACGIYLWQCVEPVTALPSAIEAVHLGRMPSDHEACMVWLHYRGRSGTAATFDFRLLDAAGALLADVRGYQCEVLASAPLMEKLP